MYYYGLEPTDIRQTGKQYRFIAGEQTYILMPYTRGKKEIEDLYTLCGELIARGLSFHQITQNNGGELLTNINNMMYILLKVTVNGKEKVCLGELLLFSNTTTDVSRYKSLFRDNWHDLWSEKVDYFEYQLSQFGKKFPVIRESFGYFSGLAENAIAYSNLLSEENLSVAHRRIHKNMSKAELYNPLNIIIDRKVRDVSEYFKDKFFHGYLPFEEVEYYMTYVIGEKQYETFYARMLFPSFYFDIYEDVLEKKVPEKDLLRVVHKTDEYEVLLYKIYTFMSQKIYITKPEWIQKT